VQQNNIFYLKSVALVK